MFQFPSNGKVCSKSEQQLKFDKRTASFNSLQTGKCVASFPATTDVCLSVLFQFPSNGKVCSKARQADYFGTVVMFQFPSNGKVCSKNPSHACRHAGTVRSFNSLQTGKCVASVCEPIHPSRLCRVSIPFKRESV